MKRVSLKLILFLCLVMAGSFGLVFFMYDRISADNIRKKAETVIRTAILSHYDSDADTQDTDASEQEPFNYAADGTAYQPFSISTDSDYERDYLELGYFDDWDLQMSSGPSGQGGHKQDAWEDQISTDPVETEILNWYKAHDPAAETICYMNTDDYQVYTAKLDYGEEGYWIYYVDVTSELALSRQFRTICWIVMAVSILAASLLGFLFGRRVEKDQKKQKQFFENASNDLKTPLMALQGYAEGLEKGIIEDPAHACHVILEESDRMASLVDEIMTLSRLESGAMKPQKEPLELSDLIEDCLMSIEYQAGQRQIEIHIDVPEQHILADRGQLERAVTNLLSNAIRHAKTEVRITASDAQLSVWNDCDPLSDAELSAVFDRFHTGPGGHTGIGLSLTREIVEKHGWRIKAENRQEEGKSGVAFIVRLQITKAAH